MRIYLEGHTFRYALEQCVLLFFPGQKAEFVSDKKAPVRSVLHRGARYATAVTYLNGVTASSRFLCAPSLDDGARTRGIQHAVKLSFYKAALLCGQEKPPWGSLTGIRPAKIAFSLLSEGKTERQALRVLTGRYDVSPQRAALCLETARASLCVQKDLSPKDIALYVGIPFCPSRCAYCSFVSQDVEKAGRLVEPYLDALLDEVYKVGALTQTLGLRVRALYIGGGTPTTLDETQLARLLDALACSFSLDNVREYSLEAGRPDTINQAKLDICRRYGVDRVSINPQSMKQATLYAIGRAHSPEQAREAFSIARQSGFSGINTDLIAGLPGETPEDFCATLHAVMAWQPENITVHTLSYKKGSRLAGTGASYAPPVERMLSYASERLREAGFSAYYLYRQKNMAGRFENVGWSQPGHEGFYNICMMEELCTVLALGAGGVSKLVNARTGLIQRVFNTKYAREYLDSADKRNRNRAQIADWYAHL